MAHRLGIKIIGECVETRAEVDVLLDCGITLMQGYLFAAPTFESLPEITWPYSQVQHHGRKRDSLDLSPSTGLPSVA
jgi:EAL domain-containing protein (putative c-di-GMP-specific phosphodiesterase class I)